MKMWKNKQRGIPQLLSSTRDTTKSCHFSLVDSLLSACSFAQQQVLEILHRDALVLTSTEILSCLNTEKTSARKPCCPTMRLSRTSTRVTGDFRVKAVSNDSELRNVGQELEIRVPDGVTKVDSNEIRM